MRYGYTLQAGATLVGEPRAPQDADTASLFWAALLGKAELKEQESLAFGRCWLAAGDAFRGIKS